MPTTIWWIVVREAKGDKDRTTLLPTGLVESLRERLHRARSQRRSHLALDAGWVELPSALSKKLPRAGRERPWQWVFPATRIDRERGSGEARRHHLYESVIQMAVKVAVARAGLSKRATCHSFRHSFAVLLPEDCYDIRTVQEQLGHKHVQSKTICTHVLDRGCAGVRSPLDKLALASTEVGLPESGRRGERASTERHKTPC